MNQKLQNPTEGHSLRFSELQEKFGPLMGAQDLRKALGFSSPQAFRQALLRKKIGVLVFSIPGRRGKFAYTNDVANWLEQLGTRVRSA